MARRGHCACFPTCTPEATRASLSAERETGRAAACPRGHGRRRMAREPLSVRKRLHSPFARRGGRHPHNASHWNAQVESRLYAMLADRRTCALGEVGLDYHYDLFAACGAARCFPPPDIHGAKVRRAAHPSFIWSDAHDDGFAILEEGWPAAGGVCIAAASAPLQSFPLIGRGLLCGVRGAR